MQIFNHPTTKFSRIYNFFFKNPHQYWLNLFVALDKYTKESFSDRNKGESASPGFLDGFNPERNRTSASVLRIEQQPSQPSYTPKTIIIYHI